MFGCGQKKESTGVILASFGDEYLYMKDIESFLSADMSSEDSASVISSHIDKWLTQKALFNEAKNVISDSAAIEQKIKDYREQLYIYEYREKYINSNVNFNISEKEIQEYYNKHLSKYVLNTIYLKAHYLALPLDEYQYYPILEKFRKTNVESESQISEMCSGTNRKYCFFSEWIEAYSFFEDINYRPTFPMSEIQYHRDIETIVDSMRYFIKIDELALKGDSVPVEVVKDDIIQMIINKRKSDRYIQSEKELLYQNNKSGLIKIYYKQ